MNKIFCIGFNKTGTTSLVEFLKSMKYKIFPENIVFKEGSSYFEDFKNGNYSKLYNLIENYDVFKDRPWNQNDFYKNLSELYPTAKFILTTRDVDDWWESYQRWDKKIKLREMWYYKLVSQTCYMVDSFLDYPNESKEIYIKRNNEILEYFKNNERFLELPLKSNDKLEMLSNFLDNKKIKKYPHLNKTIN